MFYYFYHNKQMGYEHIHGPSLDDERETQGVVLLKGRLIKAIQKLNPWISDNNLNKILRSITHIQATSLMEANQLFHENLVNMISIQQDLGKGKEESDG